MNKELKLFNIYLDQMKKQIYKLQDLAEKNQDVEMFEALRVALQLCN